MIQTKTLPATEATTAAKGCATLLVHAEAGLASSHRVEVAARLARGLEARLIGLGAETFDPGLTTDPFFGYAATEWVALVQEQIGRSLQDAEASFRRDAAGADIEWRAVQDYPARALARAARAADLIVMSPRSKAGATRAADPADVVMTAGRPVLVAPLGSGHLHATSVVVAWKDTRECRRAVADAMPFLLAADEVIVQAVCEDESVEAAAFQTEDVATSLKRHGVKARANVTTVAREGVTAELQRICDLNQADLIVAGAFGHSRAAEWAFGGVTDDLLHRPGCFVLLSH
jgi:nucleotide-binding universal stress UspA family protein